MKIFYISSATFPSEKSNSLSIMRVCQAFHDAGHDVTLFGQSADMRYSSQELVAFYGLKGGFSVVTHELPRYFKSRLSRTFLIDGLISAWRTRSLFKQLNPDLVYSRLTLAELTFVPAKMPLVYEMHSLGPMGQKLNRRWAFKLLTIRKKFVKIVVTTEYLAKTLKEKLSKIDIVVARLSADLPMEIDPAALGEFRAKEVKGANFSHHVGYTGYIDSRGLRGTDIIIKSAAKLSEVAFHIVGGEPEVVEYWREYAQQHNKNDNIFFYGHRNPNEMPYFLNCFDVTLAPLQYRPTKRAPIGENMSPLKLPQYLSYGKAIVASDIPAHRECLLANETALLVKHDSVDEWVKAIHTLIHDISKRKVLSERAVSAYYASFTHDMRVKNILSGFVI